MSKRYIIPAAIRGRYVVLGSGEINHFGPGENSQFRPDENRQLV